jgi:hypothetical protein
VWQKQIFPGLLASFIAFSCTASGGSALGQDQQQSKNLEETAKHTQTKTGKKLFKKEIKCEDEPNFGTRLPSGLTLDELSALVFGKSYNSAIGDKASIRDGVGVIKFPGQPGLFVGAGAVTDYAQGSGVAPLFIAVFKLDKPHAPQLLARTAEPFNFAGGRPLTKGKALTDVENIEDHLTALDRATFQIAPGKYAFGLRLSHQDIYTGGGGEVRYLHLFTVDNGKIRPVFGGLIYDFQMIAREWNKDGTRHHPTFEDTYTLAVEQTSTDGYRDLALTQNLGGKQRCHYTFDSKSDCYAARGKEPAPYFAQNKGQ